MNLREVFWPCLEPRSDIEAAQDNAALRLDLAKIRRTGWSKDADAALDEARRLIDAESDRRRGADTKAATYLAVVGVLVPGLTSFLPAVWKAELSPALTMASLPLLFLAIAYLLASAFWAFKTMQVSVSVRVDPGDMVEIWSRPRPKGRLAAELLVAVRLTRDPVNEKISSIKVTHEFLLRAFVTFALLLLLQVAWKPASSVVTWVQGERTSVGSVQGPASRQGGRSRGCSLTGRSGGIGQGAEAVANVYGGTMTAYELGWKGASNADLHHRRIGLRRRCRGSPESDVMYAPSLGLPPTPSAAPARPLGARCRLGASRRGDVTGLYLARR